jgi:hypothetical protein
MEKIYLKLALDKKYIVRAALASNDKISEDIQKILFNDGSLYVTETLAENKNLSKGLIQDGITIGSSEKINAFKLGLFKNKNLSANLIDKILSKDYDFIEYLLLCINESTPKNTREYILSAIKKNNSSDFIEVLRRINLSLIDNEIDSLLKNDDFKIILARNPSLEVQHQLNLAREKNDSVRLALASNPNLNVKTLKKLSKDKNYQIKVKVIRNSKSTIEILDLIKKDKDHEIAEFANEFMNDKYGEKKYSAIIEANNLEAITSLAFNENTPICYLEQIAKKFAPAFDSLACVALAKNPNTPPHVITNLKKSKNPTVLSALASIENIEIDFANLLIKSKDAEVRKVLANPAWFELPSFINQCIENYP